MIFRPSGEIFLVAPYFHIVSHNCHSRSIPNDYSQPRTFYPNDMPIVPASRRVRTAAPQPQVRRLVLTEADYVLLAAIDRHGPLPSSYLYEFTRSLRRDRTHLQNRLTEFYHGDARGRFLTRPPQQFASYAARYQHVVYDLTPRARVLLAERDFHAPGADVRSDPFVHRLMTACVGASFELGAPEARLDFISLRDILSHPRCGAAARSRHPLGLPLSSTQQSLVVPDLLFGLYYAGVGYRFFAVEIDRHTESIERRNLKQSAFARKIAGYVEALRQQTHDAWWGVPNLHVLTVTTSAAHARNLRQYVAAHVERSLQDRFLFSVADQFGSDWRVPATSLPVFGTIWRTSNGVKDIAGP